MPGWPPTKSRSSATQFQSTPRSKGAPIGMAGRRCCWRKGSCLPTGYTDAMMTWLPPRVAQAVTNLPQGSAAHAVTLDRSGHALNNKATPRLADVPAAQNDEPSHRAVGPAPSLHHCAASAWVALCVSYRAMTCHGPACRIANNAARFCFSRSPLTLRERSCRDGGFTLGLQGALSSTVWLVCADALCLLEYCHLDRLCDWW